MTLKLKILIDKAVGIPCVFILNAMFILLNNTKLKKPSEIKKILVCKFIGMGSIIQTSPLLHTLKNNFPASELSFLTIRKNHDLVKMFPYVDRILTVDESSATRLISSTFYLIRYLRKNKYDVFIDLEIYSWYSKILTGLSSSIERIGFYRKGITLNGIYTRRFCFNVGTLVIKNYLESAKYIGCSNLIEELDDYKGIINHNEIPGFNFIHNYIVINPNASDLRIERKWPAVKYTALINRIMELYPGICIVLTGSPDEHNYVSHIKDGVNEKYHSSVVDTSGNLELKQLINLIDNSLLMITNDSGPMHISFFLNKKTIALFGPGSPSGYLHNENFEFVYNKISCSPCVHDYSVSPCFGDNQCMKQITVEEVLDKVKSGLSSSKIPR